MARSGWGGGAWHTHPEAEKEQEKKGKKPRNAVASVSRGAHCKVRNGD